MLDPRFVLLAAAIDLSGILTYARDTFKGYTKPNRVTWLLWVIIPFITFFAQMGEGVGWPSLLTLVVALGPALVVAASFFNRQAYWQISKFDIACGALSATAVVLWLITRTGLIAIILSIAADFLAGVPTLIKSYREPHTESANAYLAGIFSGGITLLTINTWNLATYSFPLYIMLFCLALFVLIKFPSLRPVRVA